MVEIRILVEGGGQAGSNDVSTANNTESLRQSLNSFFCRLLCRDDVSISLGYSYRNAAKRFLEDEKYNALFVDLDAPKTQMSFWFEKLKTENASKSIVIPLERQKNVYFMIQEMEAWFLKQPVCLEKWAATEGYEKRDSKPIDSHNLIFAKNIEDITKPSETVKVLLKHFFEKKVSGEKRKLASYGKLKTAPILLDCLDASLLAQQDSELCRFKECYERK